MNPLFGLPGIASTGAVSRRKKSKPKSSGFKLIIAGGHLVKSSVKGTKLTEATRHLVDLWGVPVYKNLGVGRPRWESRRIAYIHWLLCGEKLQPIEIFHLNALRAFGAANFFEEIHVRVAGDGRVPAYVMRALESVLGGGLAKLDVKGVKNSETWEWGTYNEFLKAARPDVDLYYMHFKGTSHAPGSPRNKNKVFDDFGDFKGIAFWSYVMYRALFTIPLTEEKPAVCGILHVNPEWTKKLGWDRHPYHASGSFQGYKGSALVAQHDLIEARLAYARSDINRMRYTVEGMMTLLFDKSKISSLCDASISPVSMYTSLDKVCPQLYARFAKGPQSSQRQSVCVANGTYKYIGGTDTFNWALCRALLDLGYDVCYYAPNMDGKGVTEKYLQEMGVQPYKEGMPLLACFANQQSGKHFIGKCPVVQTCHSKFTTLEFPIKGASAYVSISEEIQSYLQVKGYATTLLRNGCDLKRYAPKGCLHEVPSVLSICQGDDTLLREACAKLGWRFKSVPKGVSERVWHIEALINEADIVVGIGRSLYDGMACGRACISWDNRKLNPYTGCGYVTEENWHRFAKTNFTGRGFPAISTLGALVAELKKYKPSDGAVMRSMAERELDMRKNVLQYLALAGIKR